MYSSIDLRNHMNKYKNWSEIAMLKKYSLTPPYQSLRPGAEGVVQFLDKGQSLLAVNTKSPYGELKNDHMPNKGVLFQEIEKGDCFTLFDVPRSVKALKAISLGTGRNRSELLRDSYRHVGEMVARLYDNGFHAPNIELDDIAISRKSGDIYLIPAIDFRSVDDNLEFSVDPLYESLAGLRSVLSQDSIEDLRYHLQLGTEL